ncbi:MAG: MFS transporter [Bdellovibrionota bacterium]
MTDPVLYLVSRGLSVLGLQILSTAFVLSALAGGASPLFLGQLGLSATIASLISTFPLGHIVDSLGRKRSLLLSQPLLLLFALALAFLPFQGKAPLLLFVAAFALLRNFRSIAQFSVFGDILRKTENPARWINLSTLSWQIAFFLGPLIAGYSMKFLGTRGTYLSAAISIALAFACQQPLLRRAGSAPVVAPTWGNSFADLKQYFTANRRMSAVLLLDFVVVFFAGASAILPYLHNSQNNPLEVGLLRAGLPLGVILGTLWVLKKPPTKNPARSLFIATMGFSLFHFLLAGSYHVYLSFALLVAAGFFDGLSLSVREVLLQVESPAHLKGRIYSINNLLVNASDELSEWESGFAAHQFGLRPTLLLGAVVPAIASLFFQKKFGSSEKTSTTN